MSYVIKLSGNVLSGSFLSDCFETSKGYGLEHFGAIVISGLCISYSGDTKSNMKSREDILFRRSK